MPPTASKLGRYKGPAIVLIISASLIAALAIPKATTFEAKKEKALVMNSLATGKVKRTEATIGQYVKVGDPLLVMTDPQLEAEIVRLENELKLAMLGTKEAVVDTSMLGMIGSLPRVVYETPRDLPKQEISDIQPPNTTTAPANPEAVAGAEKQADQAISKVFNTEVELAGKEGELQEATVKVGLAEADVTNAERTSGTASKERERLQKLYDMGAIAKNKLDAGIATAEQSTTDVQTAKTQLDQAKEAQSALEKQIAKLKIDLANLKTQLEDVRTKLKGLQSKVVTTKTATTVPSETSAPVKKVKRIVYGTTPVESNAPLEVKLIDSDDPNQDKKVEAIRAKLLELKKRREALRVTADTAGVVVFMVGPNMEVRSGDHIITIQP